MEYSKTITTYPAPSPDNLAWPTHASINDYELDEEAICVTWSDGSSSKFHPLWLRDNCACKHCLHPVTYENLSDVRFLSIDMQASELAVDEHGQLQVIWANDGHQSVYNTGWLYAFGGTAENVTSLALKPSLWDANDISEPHSFNAIDQQVDDDLLHEILLHVCQHGLARIRGFGPSPTALEHLALRVGPIRETHFDRIFEVISRANADSNAYTSEALAAHTDIPTRELPPGLQLLHCLIADAEGGESMMTDGFKVAADIAEQFPEDYRLLCDVKWCYASRAGETDYRWHAPVIGLDDEGELNEIRLLPFSRAPLELDYDKIKPSYRALKRFMQMANSPEYQIRYPFVAGDVVIFDNRRILHGRAEFFPTTGDRELRGLYLDRDDVYSKIRMHINEKNRQT